MTVIPRKHSFYIPLIPLRLELKSFDCCALYTVQPQCNLALDSCLSAPGTRSGREKTEKEERPRPASGFPVRLLSLPGFALPSAEARGEDFCRSHRGE